MKKSIVYWVGLILVGFSLWALFNFFWIFIQFSITYPENFFTVMYGPVILLVGATIFAVIGIRMMKEGKEEVII